MTTGLPPTTNGHRNKRVRLKKPKSPAYQWYPKEVLSDARVIAMTNEVEGIYRRLLDHAWLENGLPADLDRIVPLCKLESRERFDVIWMQLDPFFPQGPDGKRRNPRQEQERTKQRKTSKARRLAALARTDQHAQQLASICTANAVLLHCFAFALALALKNTDQKQEEQRALPARARPSRMDLTVWNVRGHLYKAAHLAMAQGSPFVDTHGVNPRELGDHVKDVATKLGTTWAHTRELDVIVAGAVAQRARQLETDRGRARLERADRKAIGGRFR